MYDVFKQLKIIQIKKIQQTNSALGRTEKRNALRGGKIIVSKDTEALQNAQVIMNKEWNDNSESVLKSFPSLSFMY